MHQGRGPRGRRDGGCAYLRAFRMLCHARASDLAGLPAADCEKPRASLTSASDFRGVPKPLGPAGVHKAMKVALLVCALAGTAAADPTGTEYIDRHTANPNADDADEQLYNAGVAFETDHSVAAAIQAFALLEKNYPNSKLSARTIAHTGRLYANSAMYDRAV